MIEDITTRAVIIGVSLFVTIATLSAIILFYNSARRTADVISQRTDIATSFDEIMNSDSYENTLTGVEVRELINKYAGNENVEINIISISQRPVEGYDNINNKEDDWLITIKEVNKREYKVISEEKLDMINPVWTCLVTKTQNQNKVILNVSLNV